MGRGIARLSIPIEPGSNQLAVLHDHRAHGKAAFFKGSHGLIVRRGEMWIHRSESSKT
jgi:hypothetical protein